MGRLAAGCLGAALGALSCVGQPPEPPGGSGGGESSGEGTTDSSVSNSSVDATVTPDDTAIPPEPACGNGILEADELCDDGNTEDDDGCSADCSAANCLVPITHATVQAGIDDRACPTVWILGGTYVEALSIARDVTLRETGGGEVVIDAAAAGRPLTVTAGSVVIGGLRLTGGLATDGGGIHNAANLLLDGTEVSGNRAEGLDAARGGGVFNAGGSLTLVGARVVDNVAEPTMAGRESTNARGGGIFSEGGTVLLLAGSEVAGNHAVATGTSPRADGGGIYGTNAQLSSMGSNRIGDNLSSAELVGDETTVFQNAVAQGAGLYAVGSTLELSGGTIEANVAHAMGAAPNTAGLSAEGGGMAVRSTIATLDGTLVRDNLAMAETSIAREAHDPFAGASGGGLSVSSNSTITMVGTTMVANEATATLAGPGQDGSASAEGGGIYGRVGTGTDTVVLELTECTLEGNRAFASSRASDGYASVRGGAATIDSGTGNASITLRLDRSLVVGNVAEGSTSRAGGISVNTSTGEAQTWLVAVNSTFSGNAALSTDPASASQGGALHVDDGISLAYTHVRLHNVTITDNAAGQAGGMYVFGDQQDTMLAHTIVQGNSATLDPDLLCNGGVLTFTTHDLVGATGGCNVTGTGDLVGQDALLLPLADNGGPTPTHALLPASLAHDGGNEAGCFDDANGALTVDQRGEPRPAGAACDIGAFELQP